MTQAKTPGLLFGDDPETIAANRNYQEALRKLTESIDTRKNRLFDPQLMAITRGFLEPGAPDFFESLGRVAKNLGDVQTAQEKENRDIAQLEFDLAGRGLEMQRQKSRQAMANRFLQEEQTGALPGGQAGTSGQRGFQIAPPDPKRLTGRQYLQMALAEGMPLAEALQKAEVIDRENIQAKESGVFNIREGRFFPTQYKEVPFQINGRTYNIPEGTALELSHLARIGDVEGFNRESRKAIRDFGQSAAAPQAVPQTSPQLAAQTAAPQGGAAAATSVQPPAAAGSPVGQVRERIGQITEGLAGKTGSAQAAGTSTVPPAAAARVTSPQAAASLPQAVGQPAAPVVSPVAEAPLVGGLFTPATKNADDPAKIERAVQYYKDNLGVASGSILNRGKPWAPEVIEQARNEVANTLERLERDYGMRLAPAQAPRAQAAPPVVPQAAPSAAARPDPVAVPPATAVAPAAAAAVQAAPSQRQGLRSQEEIAEEKRQKEIQQAADTRRAEDLAKAAAAKEAAVEANDRAARNTYQSASKILDYIKKSPNYFGIFARPGVVPAIGGFIEQGLRTPTGTIDLPGFRDSITKLMPNVRQQDLDNLMLAAAELAEIELNFSRTYFQGTGSVTENERKIVRAIPGTISSSPRVLKARMELLRDRSQYEIDVADAFRDWQQNNAGRSYLDFERNSQLYKDIKKDFDTKAAKIYNGLPAIPSRERARATGTQPSGSRSADNAAASDRLREIMGRQ